MSNKEVTEQSEKNIIRKVIAGDANAFALLVNKYKDISVLLANSILLNQEDAEEVAQDAFLKVFNSLHTFKGDARFSTWLYRIIVNTALNKKKLKKHSLLEISEDITEVPIDNDPVFAAEIIAQHRQHIQRALQSLKVNERLCITLYYLNELSVEEISELTNITRSNIKVLLHRGRRKLYEALLCYVKSESCNLIHPS